MLCADAMLGLSLALVCCISCVPAFQQHPVDITALGIFTLCESYVLTFVTAFYETSVRLGGGRL